MPTTTSYLRSIATLVFLAVALAAPAQAQTVTATLRFVDGDGDLVPIKHAKVEVWRFRGPGIWGWNNDQTVFTNSLGQMSTVMPFVEPGVVYALRVFATNSAAEVYTQDIFTAPFYREPGRPGAEIQRRATAQSDVLDFSFDFPDTWARNHFNAADAIIRGRAYADARRDPRETDVIPRIAVLVTSTNTFYDPISHLMRLHFGDALDDFTILHEYAHFLEEQISSFVAIAAIHDGCDSSSGVSAAYAWMEGFANYFVLAVALQYGSEVDGSSGGSLRRNFVENPVCPTRPEPRSWLEVFVAGALWDIVDITNEANDMLCHSGTGLDRIVFQIFDHELDVGWPHPTIQQFANAWVARGLDLPPLISTIGTSGVTVTAPAAEIYYDSLRAANIAVWRPHPVESQWHILGGGAGGFWLLGGPNDRPVPADYDGDGRTDIAVWRPSDGMWYVRKSRSGVLAQQQWGAPGDIPLAGDYDGDNELDYAVYRPSTTQVYIFNDSCGASRIVTVGFGTPIVGDFNGDGSDEPAVYNSLTGWFTIRGAGGSQFYRIGTGGGTPVIADYDGDGKSDLAVYRPSTGYWDIRGSMTGPTSVQWGVPGDVPTPADIDDDGRWDLVVWRPSTGTWWIREADGFQWAYHWGTAGDIPVPAP